MFDVVARAIAEFMVGWFRVTFNEVTAAQEITARGCHLSMIWKDMQTGQGSLCLQQPACDAGMPCRTSLRPRLMVSAALHAAPGAWTRCKVYLGSSPHVREPLWVVSE